MRRIVLAKLWKYAKALGLSDDERHEFTGFFLRTDDPSWASLTDEQAYRLLDAFEGFLLIQQLVLLRAPIVDVHGTDDQRID